MKNLLPRLGSKLDSKFTYIIEKIKEIKNKKIIGS